MERRWLKVLTVVAIAAGAAACERSAPLTSPTSGPRMAVTPTTYTLGRYILLSQSGSAAQTKSAIINQWGGKINFGANSLQVPVGAVSGPTKFTFTLQSAPVAAKLSAVAVSYDSKGKAIDGAPVTVFSQALTLTVSYAGARETIPDPTKMVVLWVENGKIMDVQKADADVKGKKLITSVTHFTDYQPAVPGDGACAPGSLTSCDPNAN